MVDRTDDRRPAEPETVWGACRATLQAGAGVAFVLEGRPTLGALLVAVAVATVVYETVRWWRWRARRPARGRRSVRQLAG